MFAQYCGQTLYNLKNRLLYADLLKFFHSCSTILIPHMILFLLLYFFTRCYLLWLWEFSMQIYRALKLLSLSSLQICNWQVVQVVLESYEPEKVQKDSRTIVNPGGQWVEEVLKIEGHASPSPFAVSKIPSWKSIVGDSGGIHLPM